MKELKPIKDKDSYADPIMKYIAESMYRLMYEPLFKILSKKADQTTLSNAIDQSSLSSALLAGLIWFKDDKFYGSFNAAIGKELRAMGASFNSLDKTYFLKQSAVPMNIRAVIGESNAKFQQQQKALLDTLNKMNNPPSLTFKEVNSKLDVMWIDLDKQFKATIPQGMQVPMVITPARREAISQEYTENMNMYIKDWYAKDIVKLREIVETSVVEGYRSDFMAHVLEAQYGVAERKAKFLARQEGSLLVSKYRETRYKEANLHRYKWSTSSDVRVRHDHKELDGKIFDWDHPPITDQATGARNNPGEDFNCRCVAIPIVE